MENKRIPFKHVPHDVLVALATKLDIHHHDGNDWRNLADKLGRKWEEILVIQDNNQGKTMTILFDYSREIGNDVYTVLRILMEMKREDAHEVLRDALPKIKRGLQNDSSDCGGVRSTQHDCSGGCCHPSMVQHQRSFCTNHALSYHDYSASPRHHMMKRTRSTIDTQPRAVYAGCYSSVGPETHEFYSRDNAYHGVPKTVFTAMQYPLQRCHHVHTDNGSRLLSPEKMEVGAEEVVYTSSDESLHSDRCAKMNFQRHKSEETGVKQLTHMDYRRTISMDSRPPHRIPLYMVNKPAYPDSAMKSKCTTGSSLEQLESLVNHQPELKCVDDTSAKIEVPKMEVDDEPVIDGSCSERSISMSRLVTDSEREERHGHKKCNTFPRSLKPPFPMEESTQQQDRSKLSKSTPKDMKWPADSGWRNIKVFVTYSNDSDQHMRTIIALCGCLRKNGFKCNSDLTHHRLRNIQDDCGWLKKKYMEADFVLVCVSTDYPSALEADDDVDSLENYKDHQLHTKYIFNLVASDCVNGTRQRYVPLLMRNTSKRNIPHILKDNYFYKWSEQSKDLMFMMTQPERRVRAMIMDKHR